MSKTRTLEQLYRDIPATSCPPGCGQCCGPTPVTPEEAQALGLATGSVTTPTDAQGTCAFLRDARCTVYERRPLMCRLFGASREPGLACDLGCKPVKQPMKAREARKLADGYRARFGAGFPAVQETLHAVSFVVRGKHRPMP